MKLVFCNFIYNSTFFTHIVLSHNGADIICSSQYKEMFSIEKRNIITNHHLLRHVESIALNLYLKLFASLQIFRYARAPQVNVVFIVTYIDRHIYPSHVKHMVPENCTIFTPAFDYPRMWHGSRTHYFPLCMSCTILQYSSIHESDFWKISNSLFSFPWRFILFGCLPSQHFYLTSKEDESKIFNFLARQHIHVAIFNSIEFDYIWIIFQKL